MTKDDQTITGSLELTPTSGICLLEASYRTSSSAIKKAAIRKLK